MARKKATRRPGDDPSNDDSAGNSRGNSAGTSWAHSGSNSRVSSLPSTRAASPQRVPPRDHNANMSPPRPPSSPAFTEVRRGRGAKARPLGAHIVGYDPVSSRNVEISSNWEAQQRSRQAHHSEMHGGGPPVPGFGPSSSYDPGWTDVTLPSPRSDAAASSSSSRRKPARPSSPRVYHPSPWDRGDGRDGHPVTFEEISHQAQSPELPLGRPYSCHLEPRERHHQPAIPPPTLAGITPTGSRSPSRNQPKRESTSSARGGSLSIYLPYPNENPGSNGLPTLRPDLVRAPPLPPNISNNEPPQAVAVTKIRPVDPLATNIEPSTRQECRVTAPVFPSIPATPPPGADRPLVPTAAPTPTANVASTITFGNFYGLIPNFASIRVPETRLVVARPSQKGTSGLVEKLLANHFKIKECFKFNTIYMKSIAIEPRPPSIAAKRQIKALLELELERMYDRKFLLAFDGVDTLYSIKMFPFQQQPGIPIHLRGDSQTTPTTYRCTLNPKVTAATNPDGGLSGDGLRNYIDGVDVNTHQEYIKALGFIMRENQHKSSHIVQVGQCFYSETYGYKHINNYVVAWNGFFKSLRPTRQGLALNVDVSCCCFFKDQKDRESISIIDYIKPKVHDFDPNFVFSERSEFYPQLRHYVCSLLKGMEVVMNHYGGGVTRKFKVYDLSVLKTYQISFLQQPANVEKKLIVYFRERYSHDIAYKALPCLTLRSTNRTQYVPMELAMIPKKVKFNGKLNDAERNTFVAQAMRNPDQRCRSIASMMEGTYAHEVLRERRDPYLTEFQLDFNLHMTEVTSRILKAPLIQFRTQQGHDRRESTVDPGLSGFWAWSQREALESAKIEWWGICDCSWMLTPNDKSTFKKELISRAREMGLKMSPVCHSNFICTDTMDPIHAVAAAFQEIDNKIPPFKKRKGEHVDLIIVIVKGKRSCCYNSIKHYGDVEKGVPLQIVSGTNIRPQSASSGQRPGKNLMITNLLMKINLKCGGRNFRLSHEHDHPTTIPSIRGKTCIYFGADVTHPDSADMNSPSIAAVVASNDWPDSGRFIARHRQQERRVEIITDLQELALDLLREWRASNQNRLPDVIIFYRDGVGESQFQQVLDSELQAVKDAASQLQDQGPYNPLVTFALVQKRHHTRLFRMSSRRELPRPYSEASSSRPQTSTRNTSCRSMNIVPGTVVDDVICHPREFDFYLCSHAGDRGTSRPSHYHMLWDDVRFSIDDFENLTNKLCYIYARATRAVSLVTPAYYAHLVAFRARVFYLAIKSMRQRDGGDLVNIPIPNVHDNLKSRMYFL